MANVDLLEHFRVAKAQKPTDKRQYGERWIRKRQIGFGSSGAVYLEIESSSGRSRAVKEIRKRRELDFKHELRALTSLSRPAYIEYFGQFFGWYEDDTHISFIMEYFSLGDLRKHLLTNLSEEEAKDISWQLLSGLRIMHKDGITHRDLKPDNIFVLQRKPTWKVKIGDFGISKRVIDSDTIIQSFVGTLAYMAPEVYGYHDDNDEGDGYTTAVDLWSVGVVTYEILTAIVPFKDDRRRLQAYARSKISFPEEPLMDKDVSAMGTSFLKALLGPQPSQRPDAETALRHDWYTESVQSGSPAGESRNSLDIAYDSKASITVSRASPPSLTGSAKAAYRLRPEGTKTSSTATGEILTWHTAPEYVPSLQPLSSRPVSPQHMNDSIPLPSNLTISADTTSNARSLPLLGITISNSSDLELLSSIPAVEIRDTHGKPVEAGPAEGFSHAHARSHDAAASSPDKDPESGTSSFSILPGTFNGVHDTRDFLMPHYQASPGLEWEHYVTNHARNFTDLSPGTSAKLASHHPLSSNHFAVEEKLDAKRTIRFNFEDQSLAQLDTGHPKAQSKAIRTADLKGDPRSSRETSLSSRDTMKAHGMTSGDTMDSTASFSDIAHRKSRAQTIEAEANTLPSGVDANMVMTPTEIPSKASDHEEQSLTDETVLSETLRGERASVNASKYRNAEVAVPYHQKHKIVVVGDGFAGKTHLTHRITHGVYLETYSPPVFNQFLCYMAIVGRVHEFTLWDTVGEGLQDLRLLSYRNADLVMVVFNIGNLDSLDNILERWAPEVYHALPACPIILVGAQSDRRHDPETIEELQRYDQSPVSFEQGEAMANKIGAARYLECSAKTGDGIEEVKETIMRAAVKMPRLKAVESKTERFRNILGRLVKS